MNDRFMRERPILPLLLSMAIPNMVSMLVSALYNIVDSFFVARINEQAMTALSLVYPVQNLINAIAIGFGVGVGALISLSLGAGDRAAAENAAGKGLLLSTVHGVTATVCSIALMPAFLRMFTQDREVISYGTQYAAIAFSFSVIIMLGMTFEKIFQSVGWMKGAMLSLLCGCIANILLDPLLIFGLGPFPALGIAGAAIATGLGQCITLAVYLLLTRCRPLPIRIGRTRLRPDPQRDLRLYTVGLPAAPSLALPSLLVSFLNALLAPYSPLYIVILGGYYKLQTFLYLPASGTVQGMRPVIGYNYGAGEAARVHRIYRYALGINGLIMAAGTLICLLFPRPLIGLFTDHPATLSAGETALRIISAGFLASTVSVTASGALEGLGKGPQSLVISLLRYLVVICPAALILCRRFGPDGIWHAFWITELLTAALAAWICRRALPAAPSPCSAPQKGI